VDEDRLHVELALLASQWLGATVLRHPDSPSHNNWSVPSGRRRPPTVHALGPHRQLHA